MSERKFEIHERGYIRDHVVLADFRNRLRLHTNPDTGQPFTEDEIQRATKPGTYLSIQADAIDLLSQAMQTRSLLLARQQRPAHANTTFLEEVHAALWLGPDARLPATGGSGTVDAPATENTIFVGSMNLGDPAAALATDPNGKRYQVLETVTTPPSGLAQLTMKAIDTGEDTNPLNGTILTWSDDKPLGAAPEATVRCESPKEFTGGYNVETDAELALRVEEVIRHRPAAGNPAHFVAWAKESSVAVESAFVYPCAFHAGGVLVCITQKRGSTEGPYGRTNVAIGTMADVTSYLVPPNSPVVPRRAYVVVTKPSPQDADLVLRVAMGRGISGGWADVDPWPNPVSLTTSYPAVEVASVTSQTEFDVTTDSDLPGGATLLVGSSAPQLMVWHQTKSKFVQLAVVSIQKTGPTAYTVTLSQAPSEITIAAGQRISPYTDHMSTLAGAIEDYFDELGPGEVINLNTDERANRAFRYPPMNEQYPSRAGQGIISRLMDALGEAAADASLEEISRNEPDLPGDLIDGPNIVTLGNLAVYPL